WQMDWIARHLAEELGLAGPRINISLSCASGVAAIGYAVDLIRSGRARAAIACGYDELSFYAYSGLSALRAITPEIIRPFDKNRKGTIFSEGAGALVLEAIEPACERGADIYATVLGHAMNNDAYHMTAPDKSGRGIISVMKNALADAGADTDEVDHVNAHGTGTPFNDKTETTAVKEIFGERAYQIPITSMKSMMGHCMGASGALETIGAALTARDGIIPPTVNLETPDPECDLDYVPGEARRMSVRTVLCNSYGFGGTNAALVLRRWRQ
ncbi:MAG: beta-ketoacyl-[acyl-carrier-protein] synthase family protein, partial [Planctomycetes bacterium]|nr:beta-ketoacyl-[acyl-carrier-protein] synthase family protein [Planctomycetota bacterium]